MNVNKETLSKLARVDLQGLAKDNGIRATKKSVEIVDELLNLKSPNYKRIASKDELARIKVHDRMRNVQRRQSAASEGAVVPHKAPVKRRKSMPAMKRAKNDELKENTPVRAGRSGKANVPRRATPTKEAVQCTPGPSTAPDLVQADAIAAVAAQPKCTPVDSTPTNEGNVDTINEPPRVLSHPTTESESSSKMKMDASPKRWTLVPMGHSDNFSSLITRSPSNLPPIKFNLDNIPDQFRVGLLSPDPNNPRPVFSPPPASKRSETPQKVSSTLPVTMQAILRTRARSTMPEVKTLEEAVQLVQTTSSVLLKTLEKIEDSDIEDMWDEDEVFEMVSMNDIVIDSDDEMDCVTGPARDQTGKGKRKADCVEEGESSRPSKRLRWLGALIPV